MTKNASRQLFGKGISPGFASGKAFVYDDLLKQERVTYVIPQTEVDAELGRVERAFQEVLRDLVALTKQVEHAMGGDLANILRAHKSILRDPSILKEIHAELERERGNAEVVVKTVFLRHRDKLYALKNMVYRDRGDDIGDLCKRVLRSLTGTQHLLKSIPPNTILVSERLLPTDTLLLQRQSVSAAVVELCGTVSHGAIFARGMGLPIVSRIANVTTAIQTGEELLVDGSTGRVIVAPDQAQTTRFEEMRREYVKVAVRSRESCMEPAITQDGVQICVMANVGNADEIRLARQNGAEGIGLYRLEQLYARHETLPSEDDIYDELRHDLAGLDDNPIIIRLLDTGGDKQLSYLDYPLELNPMLGRRGVRFLLDYPELLSSQLKALLKLSREIPIRILVPMVTLVEDMKAVRQFLTDAARQFGNVSTPLLGAMIETPAAALCAAQIAEHSDFLSIGTNDLAQYVMAAERETTIVSNYYMDDHPAVISLISQTTGAVSGKEIAVCGELAGNPRAIGILLEFGIRQLSVGPLRVPAIKEFVRSLRTDGLNERSDYDS